MHQCSTKHGVVQCSCDSGYRLADDRRTCIGQQRPSYAMLNSGEVWGCCGDVGYVGLAHLTNQ